MTEISTPTAIDPRIEAGVTERLAVGRYTLLIHPEHGAIVQTPQPGGPALPQLRLLTGEELSRIPEPEVPLGPRERSPLALLPNDEKHLLASLAAVGGGPLGGPHLLAVAGVPDPAAALKALLDEGLIQADSLRYSLTGNLAEELPRAWDLKDWRNRALTHFLAWSEANPSAVSEETDAVCCLVEHASKSGLHAETVRLGRALENALLASGRWNAWAATLERIRGAAVALGDRKTEAWTLHQLGTRAFCLDDRTTASDRLTQALEIREAIGDGDGAAVTFHNMGLLLGPRTLARAAEEPRKHGLPLLLFWILVPVLAMVVGAVIASRSFNADEPEPEPAEEVSLDDAEPDTPPVAIEEEGAKEEEPPVSDSEPPQTSEAPVSEPTTEPVVSDVEVAEETAPSAGAELQVLPNRLDFGDVPIGSTSEALDVIVSNPGSAPLTIDSVAIRGVDSSEFTQDGQCDDTSISPGSECRFGVVFNPQGRGRRNARLVVTSRAAGFTRRVEMVGSGVEE
ncbi:MAG TPA: choice-of-anchor D domain-containing protein [Thermoanaerobaculia bacterium]